MFLVRKVRCLLLYPQKLTIEPYPEPVQSVSYIHISVKVHFKMFLPSVHSYQYDLQLSVCSQVCQKPADSQVCQKPAEPQLKDESNMESQLNPDAAEFVPSPTQTMPSMEEILLARSPSKGVPMEDITIPSQLEFQNEVSQRPSELDLANESPELPENKPVSKLPDLISSEVDDLNPFSPSLHLENKGVFSNILEHEQQNDTFPDQQDSSVQGLTLDESEVMSTKAEFGDDTVSFLTIGSELQKTVTESVSSLSPIEKSFTDSNFLETEQASNVAKSDSDDNELLRFNEVEVCLNKSTAEETALLEDGCMILENAVPVCFEVQKELVPEMELKPERVELDSEGTSSFDDSGSPLQAEDKQLGQPEDSTTISQVPDSPVNSPVSNLHPPVPEELTVTSQVEEPSLQDSLVTDMPSPSAECPVSCVEAETVPSKPLQSPFSTHEASFWGSASPIQSATPELSQDLENQAQAVVAEFKAEAYPREIPSPPPAVSEVQEQLNSENFPMPTPDEMFAVNEQCPGVEARIETEEVLGKYQEMEVNSPLLDPFGNVTSQYDVTEPRQPLEQDVCTVPSSLLEQRPVEDEVKETVVMQKLPPIPVHVPEEILQPSDVELPSVAAAPAELVQILETVGDAESEGSLVAAAAAATAVATAAAAGAIVAHAKPAEETNTSEKNVEAKKPTPSKDKKEPTAVKIKQTKTPSSPKTATAATGISRVLPKSKLTSPTKPPPTTLRSSTPKKCGTSAPPPLPASRTMKSPATANKPKPGATSPTKPLSSSVKPTSVPPHSRPVTTATKPPILSNGDVRKPAVAKKTAALTSAKPQSRPATAPATAKAGTIKQSGTVTNRTTPVSTVPPRPKCVAVDGVASKSRPAGTVAARNRVGSACDTKSVTDKKETANKQLSTHIVASKSTTVTTLNAVATATRRGTGVTKTTVMSSVSKVAPKKTTSARTITGTRAPTTASTKTTKTEVTAASVATENNEILKVQQVG
jgi:protein phosphatase 1E